jgi:hypothetical protein
LASALSGTDGSRCLLCQLDNGFMTLQPKA